MEKVRKILVSDWYTVILFVLACLVVITGTEVFGTLVFAIIIGASMALTDDWVPPLQGVMLTFCFAIRCKHSFDDFMKYWYLAAAAGVLILLHFIFYKFKFRKGSCFNGILATSLAVTLGGVGIITAKEYFSSTSIFYIIMLGFGMLFVYSYMSGALDKKYDYDFSERFAKIMVSAILLLSFCLAEEYISRAGELTDGFDILPFQWRNNGSTMLMLAMPFAFYLSVKKFGYFFVGMLSYGAILLAGSRGGMIFGLIELVICMAVMLVIDKRHRLAIIIVAIICLAGAFAMRHALIDMVSYTIERLLNPAENAIRLELIPRGIEDFLSNPLFGRGIGYMGNSDVHNNAEFTLCWYHCSPVQVIGSFGVFGIAAYGYLLYLRIKTLIKNFTFFNITMFLSYIGLEMMSFVNPGIFVPFPYLFLVTVYFVIMERCNSEKDKQLLGKIVKGEK